MRCLIVLAMLVNCEVIAQSDPFWAIPIQGPPTPIYRTADSSSVVVVRITSDDVLLVRCEGAGWCRAEDRQGRQGYVPRSVVLPLTELDDKAAARWMGKIFQEEERLGRALNERVAAGDSLATMAAGRALNDLDYERNAALSLFTPYFCRTGDIGLLHLLMFAIGANPGSASEGPPYRLTLALECRPDAFKQALATMDSADATVVIEATSDGLMMRFDEKDPAEVQRREALLRTLRE
jgi:hypothetical protein